MAIKSERIRAIIEFGDVIVKTPYVLSFNITKTRNSKSTFNATLKVRADALGKMLTNEITISAGVDRSELIFTGYILSYNPSICFEDPSFIILNLSGADILQRLDGQKYTRRQIDRETKWASIEGVVSKVKRGGAFKLKNTEAWMLEEDTTSIAQKEDKNTGEDPMNALAASPKMGKEVVPLFKFGAVTATEEEV